MEKNRATEKYRDDMDKRKREIEEMKMNYNENSDNLNKTGKKQEKEPGENAKQLERIQSYEEGFAKIEAATNIKDIDTLVNTFIIAEENFALFRFVNDLSNDIEATKRQIADMNEEMAKFTDQGASSDNKKKKELHNLEDKLQRIELGAEQFELEYQHSVKKVSQIKTRIESIFELVECDADQTQDLLGSSGVTESNMIVYLGIIEGRINELLQAFALMQQEKITRAKGADFDKEDPYYESL